MNSPRIFTASIALAALLLAGCGGGSDAPAAGPLPTSSPPPSGTSTLTLGSMVQAVQLPATAGFSGSIYFPNATTGAGTSVSLFAGISPPLGTPIMQGSVIGNQPAPIPLLYVTITPSAPAQLAGAPAFTVTLPSYLSTSGFMYYVGYFDPSNPLNGYQPAFEGPGSVNGQTVGFTQPTRNLSLKSAMTYSFSLYEVPVPSPSPSSTP